MAKIIITTKNWFLNKLDNKKNKIVKNNELDKYQSGIMNFLSNKSWSIKSCNEILFLWVKILLITKYNKVHII